MSYTKVLRLGEICIRVLDMEEARVHYGERVGLIETSRDGDKTYYKGWDEWDCHSIVLREADEPGVDYVAYKVLDDAALVGYDEALRARGIEVRNIEQGVYHRSGRRIEFDLPTGHRMQLYAEKEQIGNTLGVRNPGTTPAEGVIKGLRVVRLDHCLLGGPNLEETATILTEVLGMGNSERLIDAESEMMLAGFYSCGNTPHDIALVLQPEGGRFHHVSFLLDSVHDVFMAADKLGRDRVPVDVGPTRHGVTRGATIYFFDPSGNRNEVFTGGYVYYPDTPTLIWDTTEIGQATFSQDNQPRESFLSVLT